VDYYVDSIMGEWTHNKKRSDKKIICYSRRAEVKLHKDRAMKWTDPETFVEYKVSGPIVLTEEKMLSIATSQVSYFRGLELTDKTEKEKVI